MDGWMDAVQRNTSAKSYARLLAVSWTLESLSQPIGALAACNGYIVRVVFVLIELFYVSARAHIVLRMRMDPMGLGGSWMRGSSSAGCVRPVRLSATGRDCGV